MNTYVLNTIEVKLTGRTASKAQLARREGTFIKSLVEVTPVDKDTGEWKTWVTMDQLFIVEGVNTPHIPIDVDDAYQENEREDTGNINIIEKL